MESGVEALNSRLGTETLIPVDLACKASVPKVSLSQNPANKIKNEST